MNAMNAAQLCDALAATAPPLVIDVRRRTVAAYLEPRGVRLGGPHRNFVYTSNRGEHTVPDPENG